MTDYKALLIKILDCLSDKAIKRIYQLAEYIYIHTEGGSKA